MSAFKAIIARYQVIAGTAAAAGGLTLLQRRLATLTDEITIAEDTLNALRVEIETAVDQPVPYTADPTAPQTPVTSPPRKVRNVTGAPRGKKAACVQEAFTALGLEASAKDVNAWLVEQGLPTVAGGTISRIRGMLKDTPITSEETPSNAEQTPEQVQ